LAPPDRVQNLSMKSPLPARQLFVLHMNSEQSASCETRVSQTGAAPCAQMSAQAASPVLIFEKLTFAHVNPFPASLPCVVAAQRTPKSRP
jgi:hypothetical protein